MPVSRRQAPRRKWTRAGALATPLLAHPGEGAAPLSFAQQRLWFLDRLAPGKNLYSVARVYDLSGRLSPAALQAAWSEIGSRHRVLRSTFPAEGSQAVQIAAPPAPLPLPVVDLGGIPPRRREQVARHLAEREADRPFDLERGPLLRLLLVRLEARRHWWLLSFHHIICDARSLELVVQELATLYAANLAGAPAVLPQPEVQYTDFVRWEAEQVEALSSHLPYWRERLAGLTELRLPLDRLRPSVRSFRGARCIVPLGVDLGRVGVLARRLRVTPFSLLLAAFAAFLRRITGQEDLPVGSPFAGRTCPGTGEMIGFFVQTQVLRIDASADPGFAELARRAFVSVAEAQVHQDLPFDLLVRALRPERTLSHNPLFQVMFAVVPASTRGLALPELDVRRIPIAASMARFDLTLEILEDEVEAGTASLAIEYSTELFTPSTILRLARGFSRLLAACLDEPQRPLSELPLLSPAEMQHLLVEWNDPGIEDAHAPVGDGKREVCLHDLFLRQAERTPEAEALVAGTERITYGELDRSIRGLAGRLQALGVGPEVLVGIFANRSLEMVVALLGTLLAGGAYVPLDPDYPEERLGFLLADAAVPLVLAQSALIPRLPPGGARVVSLEEALAGADGEAVVEPGPAVAATTAENLAYVIYTSGSTGRPKGVAVTHRGAVARMRWARRAFSPMELAGVLASTSICFDVSVFELFAPLAWGGKVILSRNVLELPRLPARDEVTTLCTVPSAMGELVAARSLSASVRTVNLAGEALHRALVERLFESPGVERVLNLYGPSEDSTYSTQGPARPASRVEPTIGRPLPGTRAHVLDRRLALLPRGAVGELCLGGAGQARGYLGRPGLTAERFVPDPSPPLPGQRLYRTGDLARHRPDGELEFLGRTDQQVKLRGFRIELGEIEATLSAVEGVREAVVLVRGDSADMSLAAFCAADPEEPSTEALRTALRARLPEYMIPGRFIRLSALPRTPNGKLDRGALAALDPGETQPAGRPPGSPLEQLIAGIWSAVLGRDALGADEDFFELGGHSLLATRVVARLRSAVGLDVGLRQLFELRTVAGLATWIEEVHWRGSRPATPRPQPAERPSRLPLSFGQERLWFLDSLEPESPVYNLPVAWRLDGELSVAALHGALVDVVSRHEVLHTVFDDGDSPGSPIQVVLPVPAVPLPILDLAGLPEGPRASEMQRLTVEEGRRPFDLKRGSLLRPRLLALGPRQHVLVLGMHHIVSDGWSIDVLRTELATLYGAALAGEPAQLPELPVQYSDYAIWQRKWLRGETLQILLDHWRQRLEGAATLDLPTDRPRTAVGSSRGRLLRFHLPQETFEPLVRLGRRTGTTLFMVLLAAFQTLLHRLTGEEDVVVGTPVAGRDHAELEPLIGFFVNTLPLRCRLSGRASFSDLLGRVRETALQAYAHQDLPFERLVEELQPVRNLARTPLFQTMFAFRIRPRDELEAPGLSWTWLPIDIGVAKLDLSLTLTEEGPGSFEFAADLFDAVTIERLVSRLRILLESIAAAPDPPLSQLAVLSKVELHQLRHEWSSPPASFTGGLCVHQLFEEQVRRTPDAVALVVGAERLTYRELDERAGRLAAALVARGVGLEILVGVYLERGLNALVAILAVLKAGAGYVPLDPAYPWERLAWMLEDSGAPVLITERHLLGERVLAAASVFCLDGDESRTAGFAGSVLPVSHPESPAYCMYTSGSTGRPKGVLVEHRAAAWYARIAAENFAIGPGDRVLQFASLSFDISVEEIFPTLSRGATLVIGTRELQLSTSHFLACCREAAVTVASLPTAYWHELCAEVEAHPDEVPTSLRLVIIGGEKASRQSAARWGRGAARIPVLNTYGPTESTVTVTLQRVEVAERGEISLGRPISGARVHVADGALHLLPVGVPGEICIGGAGLARGYLGRPGRTAERFVPDPFSRSFGARLYRTGDRACLGPDSRLRFLGRFDDQVKVRGFRIEPGEIETALLGQQGVQEAAVVLREDETGQERLVAYVAPAGLSASELRESLARELPDFMVPAALVPLDALPLSPNGKLDRSALPAPRRSHQGDAARPPRSPLQEVVAGIWEQVLGLDGVGPADSFFELGGHSLKATQVVSRLRQALGVELPVRSLFEASRLEDFAWRAAEALGPAHPAPGLVPAPRLGRPPLSFGQERMWFLDHLEPDSPVYNLTVAWRLEGNLVVPALGAALTEVVRRHEALRTVFDDGDSPGTPSQVILPAAAPRLRMVDLGGLPEGVRSTEARRRMVEEGRRPFDLKRGPLLRAVLLALDGREHVLVLGMHHIISDGWSIGVLWTELAALYGAALAGEAAPLADLQIQYPDYATWQREWLQGEALETLLDHWRQRLDGAATLDLPTDRPRPAVRTLRGGLARFQVPEAVAGSLVRLARDRGATLFMVLLAAFQTLLHRLTGEEDVVVGTPVAGRNHVELEPLIGFFVNSVLVRCRLSAEAPFSALLDRVREATLQAYAHQDLPFEKLVEALHPARDLAGTPIFQAMFVFQNTPSAGPEMPGLSATQLPVENGISRFDVTLVMSEPGGELGGFFEYNADLFDATTVRRLATHLPTLLAALGADADRPLAELPILSTAERHQIALEWNDTAKSPPGAERLDRCLAEQVLRTPEAAAIRSAGRQWSYRQLDGWARRLARRLRRLGVGPETRVGVCLERSPELIGSLVGILKAGGAYVPFDPAHPEERIAFLLADSGARLVVTDESLATRLPGDFPTLRIDGDLDEEKDASEVDFADPSALSADHLAYVIYTSGSTGEPKGVMASHRSVANLSRAFCATLELTPGDRLLMVPSVSFDASVGDIFPALLSGATLVLHPRPGELSGLELQTLCEDEEISVLDIPAALWQKWVEDKDRRQVRGALPALRKIVVGGESLPLDHLETWSRLIGSGTTLLGPYGPTEATVCTTLFALPGGAGLPPTPTSRLPIGRPLDNLRVHLFDGDLQPVGIGRPGEVYIGGVGVTRGYLDRPASTAERFVPDASGREPGGRLYRSGDLASLLPTGDLLFLGRVDNQVKIRGFRIEPGEIEAALLKHSRVRRGAVVAHEGEDGEKSLVAYVVADEGDPGLPGELRTFLKKCLPAHAVPTAFLLLDELPLNPHGKIDYRALPAPDRPAWRSEVSAEPLTPTEERLAGIWRELLGPGAVGARDDFFDLGGHSLLAVQLITRVRESFDLELPLRAVFENPTVASFAEMLDREGNEESEEERQARLIALVGELPDDQVEALLAESGER